ncbi:MAG TPA: flagellar biosynthesis protein FlhF [Sulfurimonas sp.]|uniref:flagellar biosynthesis protein FlhF n=2 Tax=Sulfurimonas sp. TaxID=2022749 RepID=UPI002B832148|nr:flagellar biosynthesis protein FlhF [Sulfurimonas sp.]HUH42358.1 flagellar biosynthesis protein FlhF [Sulfurimonas sp.]
MKILTFVGKTPSDALKKAKMSPNYSQMLHIDTKEIQKKSLGRDALYEIIMGIEDEPEQTYQKNSSTIKDGRPLTQKSADVLYDISYAAKQISKIAEVKDPLYAYQEQNTQSVLEPKELKEIKSEIAKLGDKVKIIQNMFWEEKSPDLDSHIPSEFAEIYRLASQSGMNKEHLDSIMRMTLEHMPFKMRENSSTIKRYFQTILRKMVPVRIEALPSIGNKKVIMLVGPTGVGKTTSVAKLAARYSFLTQKKYKVGLIVLDTYRIGAVEQLMQYARMMKLAIETVVDPSDFASALDSLKYCDYILIDTMGSSPYDRNKIEKIYECLDGNDTKYNIEVVLVMPSSIKYEDLKATYENFSSLNIDTLMFTKLDETKGFGNIFSLAYETKKPISYFSVGQEVPEDLVCATSDFLVECLLNGFNRSKA